MYEVIVSKIDYIHSTHWLPLEAAFGHVDNNGILTGVSTGDGQVRVHFVQEPTSEQLTAVAEILDVETVQVVQSA